MSRDAREAGGLEDRSGVFACSRPLAEYYPGTMTNCFGVALHPDRLRWAAAEGVTEDVIAAVLLLHERSVGEIVPKLSPAELEKVIVLVGRSPRLYPLGIVEALERRRRPAAPVPAAEIAPKLRPAELEKVFVLVGRNPRLYPPGTLNRPCSLPWS